MCALPDSLPHSIQVSHWPMSASCWSHMSWFSFMGCLEIISSVTRLALYRNCLVILGSSDLISSFYYFICPFPPQILVFLFQKLQRCKCQSSGAVTVPGVSFLWFPSLALRLSYLFPWLGNCDDTGERPREHRVWGGGVPPLTAPDWTGSFLTQDGRLLHRLLRAPFAAAGALSTLLPPTA